MTSFDPTAEARRRFDTWLDGAAFDPRQPADLLDGGAPGCCEIVRDPDIAAGERRAVARFRRSAQARARRQLGLALGSALALFVLLLLLLRVAP